VSSEDVETRPSIPIVPVSHDPEPYDVSVSQTSEDSEAPISETWEVSESPVSGTWTVSEAPGFHASEEPEELVSESSDDSDALAAY
jgi:hypothetical protein